MERTFTGPQIIPPIFSQLVKGCAMFKQYFLYHYRFHDDVKEIKSENYITVKQITGGKQFIVYSDSELELNVEQEEKSKESA